MKKAVRVIRSKESQEGRCTKRRGTLMRNISFDADIEDRNGHYGQNGHPA